MHLLLDELTPGTLVSGSSLARSGNTGVSTCTHLNDVFRSLADVAHLWSLVPAS